MPAVQKALYIEQGATFRLGFTWTQESETTPGTPGDPYDITGCTARMQIRKSLSAPAFVTATTENGKIEIGDTDGHIAVYLSDEDTDLLISRTAVYDFEIEFPGGDVYRLLEGKVTISPNVTRDEP